MPQTTTLSFWQDEQQKRLKSLELKITSDGSATLFVPGLQEHYHSVHGAMQESEHVFIKAGLQEASKYATGPIKVLEVGLGTGLNALLTCVYGSKNDLKIDYHAIEAFPLPLDLAGQLNYSLVIGPGYEHIFKHIHKCGWEKYASISADFCLVKTEGLLQETELAANRYHVIYFDAFAPGKQPELWTEAIFKKTYTALQTNGVFVTYCAKGEVKRTLRSAGFFVESLPGPPGKREMIRARKINPEN